MPHSPLHIIAEESIPYLRGVVEQLGHVTYLPSAQFTPHTIKDAHWLIVRSITHCTQELLQGSQVKLITTATIGFDHIDAAYCQQAGITWHNAPGCNAPSVAQYFAATIARLQVEQGYQPQGKVLGIVGAGHVGLQVKRVAEILGMQVLLNDPPRQALEGTSAFVPLSTIAQECDIISFHTPLTPQGTPYATHHLCNWNFISSLRHQPILFNTARGAVTDTQALIRGKEEGYISELVIDCWESEPHISTQLLHLAYQATPHIAGFSADGKCNASRTCLQLGATHFGVSSPLIASMQPPAPSQPLLHLDAVPSTHRVAHLLLATADLRHIEADLRHSPHHFSTIRKSYPLPREPHAYTIIGTPTPHEAPTLRALGFQL